MRITIDLPDDVARRLSDEAEERSTTTEEAAVRILAAGLAEAENASAPEQKPSGSRAPKRRFELIGVLQDAQGLPASDEIDEYLTRHWPAHLRRESGLDRDPG